MLRPILCLAALTISSLGSFGALAADAPQFRGPERDGLFADTGLLKSWPDSGPAQVWSVDGLGKGYASVASVGGVLYTTGMLEDNQGFLFAIDGTGKVKWKAAYGPEVPGGQAPGSRATPTVDGDRIYVLSGTGTLYCMAASDGATKWSVDLLKTFNGAPVEWQFSESPLVDGNVVYATPGGPDASVVALDKMTGKTIWTSKGFSEPSAYCSPVIFDFGANRVLVTMTAKSVVGLDVATGKLLWTHPHETDYDIHAVTPVRQGNIIYYTAGYGSGGGALEVNADGSSVKSLWTDKNLDCQHHGVVLLDGYIYGTGHKNSALMCLELATGKLMWRSDEVTQGDVISAEGMLYVYEGPKKGVVSLVKASPKGFERTGSFKVPQGRDKHWANPAIADGRLYIRYNGALYAYDIKAK